MEKNKTSDDHIYIIANYITSMAVALIALLLDFLIGGFKKEITSIYIFYRYFFFASLGVLIYQVIDLISGEKSE